MAHAYARCKWYSRYTSIHPGEDHDVTVRHQRGDAGDTAEAGRQREEASCLGEGEVPVSHRCANAECSGACRG